MTDIVLHCARVASNDSQFPQSKNWSSGRTLTTPFSIATQSTALSLSVTYPLKTRVKGAPALEEADCRLIPHVHMHNAVQCQSKRVLILSNDTDVVLYTLAYHDIYEQQGIEEL